MSDRELHGGENAIGINESNTVGVIEETHMRTNETRTAKFSTGELVQWAKAVHKAYDSPVEVVFTPEKPLVAKKIATDDTEVRLGVGVSPRLPPGALEGEDND